MPRLNKFLALSGLGSRRKVEQLITDGRIRVNGTIIKNLATSIDTDTDKVTIDGKIINAAEKYQYIILNKPVGYITTLSDDRGRKTVMDLIPEKYKRIGVFPVGRLDKDTEGLLLFTNDGALGERLNRPAYHVTKVYIAELDKELTDKDKMQIEKGIYIHQTKTKTRPAKVERFAANGKSVKIEIHEGKKRQIRYTFLNAGYKVVKLKRIAYGPISLSGLNRGTVRPLRKSEVSALIKAALERNDKERPFNIKPAKEKPSGTD
jgi:23S rRNA pseudouridine2605 synthase